MIPFIKDSLPRMSKGSAEFPEPGPKIVPFRQNGRGSGSNIVKVSFSADKPKTSRVRVESPDKL